MKTREEYIESLRALHLNVYFMGKKIDNPVDHPMIRPSLNSLAMTYELAQQEEYKDLMTATSNITGKTINRFCHIHQSAEDLVKKVKMQRLLGQKTASCFQRCVGMMLSTLSGLPPMRWTRRAVLTITSASETMYSTARTTTSS